MLFHSTNGKIRNVAFPAAIENGLARDGGLYMPDSMPPLPTAFFKNISEMSLREIGYVVCNTLLGDLISSSDIKKLIDDSLNYPVPMRPIGESGLLVAELFHGPTLSCKDMGARFMARVLPILLPNKHEFTVILATSGDSGGAIADSFSNRKDANVIVLFPRGELSRQQVAMFSLRRNVLSVEVGGTFDDCQQLVKQALLDEHINSAVPLTSGNSINLARQIPAIIGYFYAYARAIEARPDATSVRISVPCGNLGNLSAALMAKRMGLPVDKFIGANNANDTFVEYLQTGGLRPRRALITLARAMDVGNPSNLARIIDLYNGDLEGIRKDVEGVSFTDREIVQTIREVYASDNYLFGPQSATAYRALQGKLAPHEVGVVMATGHPSKFPAASMEAIGHTPTPPPQLENLPRQITPDVKIPPSLTALSRVILQSRKTQR
jgi:threonine synthase